MQSRVEANPTTVEGSFELILQNYDVLLRFIMILSECKCKVNSLFLAEPIISAYFNILSIFIHSLAARDFEQLSSALQSVSFFEAV